MPESLRLCLSVCLPSSQTDEISFQLWELGIEGIQELPSEEELYQPQAGTEFREPQQASDWTHDEKLVATDKTRLKVFFERKSLPALEEFFKEQNITIDSVEEINPESFLEKYRENVKGKSFGDGFWIGPPWAKEGATLSEKDLLVDPGMAFGTGEHPTTQMCVEAIWNHRALAPQSILDLGAGSGILSLACRKWIPKAHVWALDTDPNAEAEIVKNIELNKLPLQNLHIICGDKGNIKTTPLKRQFNWILSNIYGEVLASLEEEIRLCLAPGGLWMATGVLDGVARKAFESAALMHFEIIKLHERRDAAPNDSLLWLCYELRSK